jgi:hypothetical protein
MGWRILGVLVTVAAAFVAVPAASVKPWALVHLPDGHPDMQGYWTNGTLTPLERPADLAGKEFFTVAEAEAYAQRREAEYNSQPKDNIHYDNVIWQSEKYTKVMSGSRTSLIYDPPDGRIPPLTPSAQAKAASRAAQARSQQRTDSAESMTLEERCISWGQEGPPMLGLTYQANLQFIQSSTAFAIRHELMHVIRIIPLDGSPHPSKKIRQLFGDSRGHWDGDTLVVDTTNYTDETPFRGPRESTRQDIFTSRDLHVIERFTRTASDTIQYRFTVDDPTTFTKAWSAEITMYRIDGPIFEYACHEGNYGLGFVLSAARVQERLRP